MPLAGRLRVLIAEDQTLVRAGLRRLLEEHDDIEVVGEASDGQEALRLIQAQRPDVVLMDISMPGLNGLDATQRAHRRFPHTHVIVLSTHRDEEYALQALQAGAAGYVIKDASPSELAIAVRAVARGETYLSPGIIKPIIADYLQRTAGRPDALSRLTSRQREVLQLIAEGHSTKAIAQRLRLSVKTVETHRTDLMARLDIHDVTGLVRYAIRVGLVDVNR